MPSALRDMEEALRTASGILLDFDGVLADSEPHYRRSYCLALEPFGLSIEPDEYWVHFTSMGEGLEGFVQRHGIEGLDLESVKAVQKRLYAGFCRRGDVKLFPGAEEVLSGLAACGRPWAIASNTDRTLVDAVLEPHGVDVPCVVGGAGLKAKPAPDIFIAAAAQIGTDPRTTLVFEDAWKGLEAARAGGFRTVLVRGALNSGFDLRADLEIDGITAIVPVLRMIAP